MTLKYYIKIEIKHLMNDRKINVEQAEIQFYFKREK